MIRSRQRWHRINPKLTVQVEEFLKARERYCVSACAKFLRIKSSGDRAWSLEDRRGNISAFLLLSGTTLFPVISRGTDIPVPQFMNRLWRRLPIYGVQGRREDVEILEGIMARMGYSVMEQIDYDLMMMKGLPNPQALGAGPAGLQLRRPRASDMDALYLLQADYEREEVLPRGAVFNPASCRMTLEYLVAREHILAAELDGRLVGKINTSALAFSQYQIGGVYVHPDYRSRGVARSMTAALTDFLSGEGRGFTLFVKKRNLRAREVYRQTGFIFAGDYRINYYKNEE
jgi:predicted GNAT family acetyltransferase